MRKTVDVYLKDRLIGSYPVVAKAIDRPTDDDFVERIKQQMRAYYRGEDIQAARFVVRGVQD
jgi:NOL1/NOP2/fmu family ribosome biogenesis protein